MTPGNNPHLDPIALGVKPAHTITEKYIRHQAEAGDILRRCMNNAREEALSLRKQLDAAQAEIERLKADHLQSLKQLDEQKEQLDDLTARNKYLEADSELQLAQWQEDTKQLLSLKDMAYTVHRQLEAAILVHFYDRILTTDEHRLLAKLERIAAKVNPYQDEHDDE